MFENIFGTGKKTKEVTVRVSMDACSGCGKCVVKCRAGAMKMRYREDKASAWVAYPSKCTGCGRCAKVCNYNAVKINELSGIVQKSYL